MSADQVTDRQTREALRALRQQVNELRAALEAALARIRKLEGK